jgi:putative tricarboxylic transport membrane protein
LLHQVFKRVALKAVKLPSKEDYKKTWKTILRSSGIGSFIGVLPAEGGTVASLIGYSEAKRFSKNPEEFGKGSIEGIAGAEAANNAATGGAMVPTLALGIPGSATTAVILTGLIIHGVRPGPDLFREQPDFLYGIFGAMLIANILFFIFGFFGAKIFARITLVPNKILWPMIFTVSVCGTYSLSQSILDVWIMLFFGVLGFFMRRFGFSVVPVIIGLILGELVEGTLRQSLVIFDGNWLMFFTRPIVVTFFILSFIALIFPLLKKKK